jgi:nucleotide-binding universal stress UspA family protein
MPATLQPKSIIVHVPAAAAAERLMHVASPLARRFGAHLTGLHVVPHIPLYVDAGMGVGADFYTAQQQALHEEAERVQEVFAKRLDTDQLKGDWVRLSGEDRPAMQVAIAFCRAADVIVASQYDETMPGGAAYFPEDLVLGSGRPVVLVPRQGSFAEIGRRVLVAWNGGRESARAAFDVLPLLAEGAEVRVFQVTVRKEPERRTAQDVVDVFTRHGLRAETALVAPSGRSVGEEVLAAAGEYGADLVVMGCYGQSRLRETIFGGVTNSVLENMALPVMMSH